MLLPIKKIKLFLVFLCVVLLLSCINSLNILDINFLSDILFLNIFSHSEVAFSLVDFFFFFFCCASGT